MGIGRFLNHRVLLIRQVAAVDDDYGQPIREDETLAADVAAGIQPRSEREVAALHQAGVQISDHRIYLLPRDIEPADAVIHAQSACGAPNDLPDARFEIVGKRDAAGGGHHLELSVRLVSGAALTAPGGS